MRTIETRQAALLAIIILLGAGIIGGNLHRELIALVWPFIESFWDTFIGIEVWA